MSTGQTDSGRSRSASDSWGWVPATRSVQAPSCAMLLMFALACGDTERSASGARSDTGAESNAGNAGAVGAAGGSAGIGGSAAVGGGNGGDAGATSVAPAVSQRWTWEECGRIPGTPQVSTRYSITSLDLSADGQFLVSHDWQATGWRVVEPFAASEPLWRQRGEGIQHVDVSEDGRMVAISGDTRFVLDARNGQLLPLPQPPFFEGLDFCILTEFRFSPDGRFVAGKRYETKVQVYETTTFTLVAELETHGCAQGLVFSSDLLTTPEGSFSTRSWEPLSALNPETSTAGLPSECQVYLEPTLGLRTDCCNASKPRCGTRVGESLVHGGKHPRFSPEGHWLVSAGSLFHVPSQSLRRFSEATTEALFAPNGDIIAGDDQGDLIRFCRRE